MSDTEKTAASRGAVLAKIAAAILTALAVLFMIQNAVALTNAPSGESGGYYLPYILGTGAAFFLLEAAIVADDLLLWRSASREESDGKRSARYVVHALCRVVCFAFIAAAAIYLFAGAFHAIRWVCGRVLLAPIVLLPALRATDFILWLAERRRKI